MHNVLEILVNKLQKKKSILLLLLLLPPPPPAFRHFQGGSLSTFYLDTKLKSIYIFFYILLIFSTFFKSIFANCAGSLQRLSGPN